MPYSRYSVPSSTLAAGENIPLRLKSRLNGNVYNDIHGEPERRTNPDRSKVPTQKYP
jgi:hypothetical protein